MNTNTLYERVGRDCGVSQDRFLAALNYTVGELCSLYGERRVLRDGVRRTAERVGDDLGVRDEFECALTDGVLYQLTGAQEHKVDFVAHAQYAYHEIWRRSCAGRRVRREVW